jgi:hypothetical protein
MSKNPLHDQKIIQNGITNWLLNDLAENSGVRGCMVIKPYICYLGKMQSSIECLKKLGIKMLISIICSKSMFEAEEKCRGFAKECAINTLQLKNDPDKR